MTLPLDLGALPPVVLARSAIPSLLFRPSPMVGEGPTGFLARVAEQNCLPLDWFQKRGIAFSVRTLQDIGCDVASMSNKELHIYLKKVERVVASSPGVWVRDRARFCPTCLANAPHWRVDWEILFVDGCADHGSWLLDRCDRCGRPVTWRRTRLLTCSCGHRLTANRPTECPPSVADLSRRLTATLRERRDSAQEPFSACDVQSLQRIVRLLGAYGSLAGKRKPQKIADLDALEKSWPVTSVAAEALADWPNAFYRILDSMVEKAKGQDEGGRLAGTFGALYETIFDDKNATAYAPLRRAFDEYIGERWPGALAKRNTNLAPTTIDRGRWVSFARAAMMRRCTPKVARAMAQQELWDMSIRTAPSGRKLTLVRRDDVENEKPQSEQQFSLLQTASSLGLTRPRARSLVRKGALDASRHGGFFGTWRVPKPAVDVLLGTLAALPPISALPENYITVDRIQRYRAWSGETVLEFFEAIGRREIEPRARITPLGGLRGMAFLQADVDAWQQLQRTRENDDSLTVRELAKALRIKEEVAYYLVRTGFIESKPTRTPTTRTCNRVDRAALARFQADYVFGRDLAKRFHMSPRAAMAALFSRGIQPVDGPTIGKSRQVIYRSDPALRAAVKEVCGMGDVANRRPASALPESGKREGCQP